MLRTLETTRFVAPLREGGSLPALAEANDGELYVVKFRDELDPKNDLYFYACVMARRSGS
jgi:hypothetical protein